MTLQSSGAISMDDMRTEFGISGAISMSDLYRGGSEVPSSVNTTVTVSEVANILSGAGYGSGHRWNHGNTATSSAGNHGYDFGYWRGGVAPSNTATWPADYYSNFTFFYNASWLSGSAPPETVVDLTFSHTGTYYFSTNSYEATNGTFKIGTSSDDDSLHSGVLGSSGSGASPVTRTGSFSATAGSAIRVSIKLPYVGTYSNIYNQVAINTDSSNSSRALSVNSSVPASGAIDFADFYNVVGS